MEFLSNIKISTSISTQPTSHKLFAKRRPKSMEDESNDISLEAGAEITRATGTGIENHDESRNQIVNNTL